MKGGRGSRRISGIASRRWSGRETWIPNQVRKLEQWRPAERQAMKIQYYAGWFREC